MKWNWKLSQPSTFDSLSPHPVTEFMATLDQFTVEDAVSSALLCIVVLLVLVGNCLVVAAVATSRKLRTVTNMFIVNLACADLLLGVLVLPFSAALEILDTWVFGDVWCQVWLAIDVWLCTASIQTLCCISFDRYLAITRPIQYPGIMSSKRAKLLVLVIWIFSFIVCCPPLIGWNSLHDDSNDVTNMDSSTASSIFAISTEASPTPTVSNAMRLCSTSSIFNSSNESSNLQQHSHSNPSSSPCYTSNNAHQDNSSLTTTCELTNSRGYRVYGFLGSFFIPMLVMVFFYVQIYRAAVKTMIAYEKGELKTKYSSAEGSDGTKANTSVTLRVHRGGGSVNSHTGLTFSQASVRHTHSSEASLVTLGDITPVQDSSNCLEEPRFFQNKTVSRGSSKTMRNHSGSNNQNFKNGYRGYRYSSQELNDGYSGNTRKSRDGGGMDDVSNKQKRTYFKSCHSRQLSNSQTSDYFSDSLSRDSSDKEKRMKRNMFSVHRPAHAMKLHMQKFNREKKAAKTLAIIVGAFICCWLPFFTIYLVGAFCDSCISPLLFSVSFWLGYCNSAMNPCVYALFSRDFRFAFRKLILCRFRRRSGSFKPQMSDLPAIQLHSPPREEHKSSSDLDGSTWR